MKNNILTFLFVLISNISMSQWNVIHNSGMHYTGVFFVSTMEGHISCYFPSANPYCNGDGSIITTHDGGFTWSYGIEYTCGLWCVFFPSPDTGFTSCFYHSDNNKSYTYKTIDGSNWAQSIVATNNNQWNWSSVYFLDNMNGYGVGNGIYKTNNGGATWTKMPPVAGKGSFLSVFFTNYQTGYIVSKVNAYKGFILKTTDGGNSWMVQDSCDEGPLRSVVFVNDSTGFVVGGGVVGTIYHTTNGGAVWTKQLIPNTFPLSLKSVSFSDEQTGYTVGDNGYIFKTIDGGYSWHEQDSPTNEDLNGVQFPSPDTGYIVGNYGLILKTINGGGYFVGQSNDSDVKSKITITPNPADGFITLRPLYAGTLNITDMRGNLLLTREMSASDYSPVDISSLSRGIYLFKLVSRNGVHTGKFVKQ